ncbi:phosphatidate cytidylyltransferase [Candidatus Phytoplasma bonamiae]|uniref:Phosphatidate cytidylyltransferase n=1 Tax=Candidatus Phytoplasma bonamiae TaxID=2982626 RepID=A0ABT9D4D6_9MOLU|nr:phosphatidate cytidylyltransferase ['Bonamia sp.' little leaf phytoplasma]MDO8063897.1 phosphatidate cytidylyltransferase ['Bonamia sp.' little leaf phytoplasma]
MLLITFIWLSILTYIDKQRNTNILFYNCVLLLITFIYSSFREVIQQLKIQKTSTNAIISHNQNKPNFLNILSFYIFNAAYGFYLIKIILNYLYNNQIIKIKNNYILHTYIKKFFLLEKTNVINNNSIILFIFLTIIFVLYIYFISKKNLKINQLSFIFQHLIIIQGLLYYFIFNNNRTVMITIFLYIIALLYNFISTRNNKNFYNKLFQHIAIFIYILLGVISIFSLFLIKQKIILYLFTISISSDIFAFLGGYFWGKNLLCPSISPKKTKEGFCFGILCTIIIINIIFDNPKKTSFYIIFFILTIINSIIAQIGDLIVSKFKRNLKIKDFGKIIPEHGGLLDRFDSILFLSLFTILIIINPFSQIIHQLLLII